MRHGLSRVREVANRVIDVLEAEGFPELVYWSGESQIESALAVPGQGDVQLWALAVPTALLALEENPGELVLWKRDGEETDKRSEKNADTVLYSAEGFG